jgi:hypothetical protein
LNPNFANLDGVEVMWNRGFKIVASGNVLCLNKSLTGLTMIRYIEKASFGGTLDHGFIANNDQHD